MKTDLMQRLQENAEWMNGVMSNIKAANPTGLVFDLEEVRVLSEDSGASIHKKKDGRRALVFWYFTNTRSADHPNGYWSYIIPTDNHMAGMAKLAVLKDQLEAANYQATVVYGRQQAAEEEEWYPKPLER